MDLFLNHSTETEETETFVFKPTLTPSQDYFQEICRHVNVPEFMHISNVNSTFEPYLCGTQYRNLRSYLAKFNHKLKLKLIPCQRHYDIGIFKADRKRSIIAENIRVEKADFNITTEDWLKSVKVEPLPQELQFKTKYEKYHCNSILNMKKKSAHRNLAYINKDTAMETAKHAIDLFDESNMIPLSNVDLSKPRSLLNRINLFENLSVLEEEDEENENDTNSTDLILKASNFDCWTVLGLAHSLNELQKKELHSKFPNSFRWLLETCAQTIGVDNSVIYEELLVLEVMFLYGLENIDDFEDCLHFRYDLPIKDFNVIINSYRELW